MGLQIPASVVLTCPLKPVQCLAGTVLPAVFVRGFYRDAEAENPPLLRVRGTSTNRTGDGRLSSKCQVNTLEHPVIDRNRGQGEKP